MKLSSTTQISDGSTGVYFYFTGQDAGYLRESDLVVTVDGVPAEFTLTSSNAMQLKVAPAVGSKILIRRVMPKNKTYADFSRGNNFREQTVNNSFLQLLYTIHELLDGYFSGDVEFNDAVKLLSSLTVEGESVFNGTALFNKDVQFKKSVVVPNNHIAPNVALNKTSANLLYAKRNGDNLSGDYKFYGKVIVPTNTPSDTESVMNTLGNDERYLRRFGDVMSGDYTYTGGLSVLVNNTDSPTAVINLYGNDNRYVKNGGQVMKGDYVFPTGLETYLVRKEPFAVMNYQTAQASYVKRFGDTLIGNYIMDGDLTIKHNIPTNPDFVMNTGGNDARYVRKEGGTVDNITAEFMRVRTVPSHEESVINRKFAERRYVSKEAVSTVTGIIDAREGRVLVGDPVCSKSAVNVENLEVCITTFEERIKEIQADAERQLSELIAAVSSGSLVNMEGSCLTYHYREVDQMILVPENCEVRTFGNGVRVLEGGLIRIGEGSHWKFTNDASE